MSKSVVRVIKTEDDSRLCRCCNSIATAHIELGQDFNKYAQTSSFYLCDTHFHELRVAARWENEV